MSFQLSHDLSFQREAVRGKQREIKREREKQKNASCRLTAVLERREENKLGKEKLRIKRDPVVISSELHEYQ